MQNVIIYLIGFPGTGKYTTAKAISELENFLVIDNQYINNPIFSLIALDGKTKLPDRVWANTAKIREAIFDTITNISPKSFNFVFTNALLQSDPDSKFIFEQVENLTKERQGLFVPVLLECSLEQLQKRIVTEDRTQRLKENSAELAKQYYEQDKVYIPEHDNIFKIETTNLSPEETAKKILEHCRSLLRSTN